MPDVLTNPLDALRIVLVEPAGDLNVGSIARVMKNMGLSQLVIVNPRCDPLSDLACQMAVHAADVLKAAQVVPDLSQALVGCQRAIATTTRPRSLDFPLETPEAALPWLLKPGVQPQESSGNAELGASALLFGPEDRGLSNTELGYAQRFVRIPANPDYPSLNLAQAVAVCCYVLYQQFLQRSNSGLLGNDETELGVSKRPSAPTSASLPQPDGSAIAIPPEPTAKLDVLEGYYQHLEQVLLTIGYLYPHTAASRMQKFRRLFNRAGLSPADVSMLRGILRQMEWKLQVTAAETSESASKSSKSEDS